MKGGFIDFCLKVYVIHIGEIVAEFARDIWDDKSVIDIPSSEFCFNSLSAAA